MKTGVDPNANQDPSGEKAAPRRERDQALVSIEQVAGEAQRCAELGARDHHDLASHGGRVASTVGLSDLGPAISCLALLLTSPA